MLVEALTERKPTQLEMESKIEKQRRQCRKADTWDQGVSTCWGGWVGTESALRLHVHKDPPSAPEEWCSKRNGGLEEQPNTSASGNDMPGPGHLEGENKDVSLEHAQSLPSEV